MMARAPPQRRVERMAVCRVGGLQSQTGVSSGAVIDDDQQALGQRAQRRTAQRTASDDHARGGEHEHVDLQLHDAGAPAAPVLQVERKDADTSHAGTVLGER